MRFNPVYIAARLCRKLMPEKMAHRLLSRRAHSVERLYYGEGNMSNAQTYLRAIHDTPARELFEKGKALTALEAGSGLYNPLSAPLMLAGVERLILLEPFVGHKFDNERFRDRFHEFLKLAEKDITYPLERVKTADQVLAGLNEEDGTAGGAEFLYKYWEDTGLPDASVDLILSASVLEHLRNPAAVMAECARILKPGGYMINVVDMRDHFFKYPLEMLRYPDWAWRLLTTREGGSGYQNRLRIGEWTELLKGADFQSLVLTNILMEGDSVKQVLPFFEKKYMDFSFSDLQILHATIISNKRAVA